jgi:hypothetical protein
MKVLLSGDWRGRVSAGLALLLECCPSGPGAEGIPSLSRNVATLRLQVPAGDEDPTGIGLGEGLWAPLSQRGE